MTKHKRAMSGIAIAQNDFTPVRKERKENWKTTRAPKKMSENKTSTPCEKVQGNMSFYPERSRENYNFTAH